MMRWTGGRRRVVLAAAVVGCGGPAASLGQYAAIREATVTPQTGSYYATNVTVPVEDNYIPNVVWRENGAAATEALKVQAVAARGYLYYKLSTTPNGGKATSIRDGTADQVYSKSGTAPLTRATATSTQLKYFTAADATEREILVVNTSVTEPQCTFYVAAGRPDTATNTATYWPGGAGMLGQWETGDQDPTSTEKWVTYNRGKTGSGVSATPLGSLSNPVNRGAMSQNGSHFLATGRSAAPGGAFAGWNYVDILKFYYGQSAQLMMARAPIVDGQPVLPANQKVLVSFDLDEGYLRNAMSLSPSNQFINYAGSSRVRDTATKKDGTASQRLTIDYNPAADTAGQGFTFRHLSGMVMGTEADPNLNDGLVGTTVSNLVLEPRGSLGLWLRTTTPGLTLRPLVDEGASATEQGVLRNVIPDGQWHRYEWFLTDAPQWSSFTGGNNQVTTQWTLDSILFKGNADAVLHLDTVFYDARTTAPANQWYYDHNGSYNFAGNWVSTAPNGVGAVANFWGATTAARAVSVDANVTVGAISFDNAAGYTVNGPAGVTLDVASGSAAVSVLSGGTHTINASLAVNDPTTFDVAGGGTLALGGAVNNPAARALTKTGAGTLTISGTQNHGAGTQFGATGGTTRFNTNAGPGGPRLAVSVSGAGTSVVFATGQRLAGLSVGAGAVATVGAGGSNTLLVQSLSLAGTGRLNLNDNDAVVDHAGASPADAVRGYLLAGRNGGTWDGAGGIVSTTAAADAQKRIAIGYGEASALLGLAGTQTATFSGVTVDATSLLLKYTWYGDANLDGVVNADDLVRLDRGYAMQLTGWWNGDFDYSGVIDAGDYGLIDRVFIQQGGGILSPGLLAAREAQFGSQYVTNLIAAVPEPGAVGLAVAGVMAGLVRPARRRRQRQHRATCR